MSIEAFQDVICLDLFFSLSGDVLSSAPVQSI